MAFTYNPATQLGKVRLLIADTDVGNQIFQDDEVQAALDMESSTFLYVSGQAQATAASVQLPFSATSILRAAALLLDALASNKSRLASITQLLDVKLSPQEAVKALREQATNYREIEENQGHFAIAEMVQNPFAARERIWKQVQRLYTAA